MAMIKIAVINEYPDLTHQEIEKVVKALNIQAQQHFGPVWGVDAVLTFYPKSVSPPPDAWQLIILDSSDQAGALGYHDLTKTGLPLGKVFAGTDKKYGSAWSVTASHELLEMLGDPDINLCALVQTHGTAGTLYAYEVCDACETDEYGYTIGVDGSEVLVSDFVYPSWFETFHVPGTQYDYLKKISQPFQLLPGGYISVFAINSGTGWTQKNAKDDRLFRMRANVGTRRERRSIPREQWLRSVTPAAQLKAEVAAQTVVAEETVADQAAFNGPATVTVDFLQGQGQITATLARNGGVVDQQSNSNSGIMVFANVQTFDALAITGMCTHSASIQITANTNPGTPKSYPEGPIFDSFDIL